jgi:hypothetical protein
LFQCTVSFGHWWRLSFVEKVQFPVKGPTQL